MAGPASLHDALGDRYAIERELGHGATATVYLARDLKLNRLVALKVLSPDLALAVRTERFLTEIDTTAQLSHPHVVPLFDGGSVKGFYYYVMPYIRGESLRERIARDGHLSVAEALRLARQVAGALDHAHRHGVIHRDIKPGNILLEGEHAWVADFGIARGIASDDSANVTATGVTIGTPAYMSPEQASGDADLDARSDIYSLGCVLYEMLAGVPPFRGPTVQAVLTQHLVEPVPSLREARPEVPEQVEQIVEIALAKDREHRFATAAEFAQALSLEGGGSLTPTRTQPVRLKRRSRVPRWAAWAAGGVLLVLSAWVSGPPIVFGGGDLDTLQYLVPPFEYANGASATLNVEGRVQDALRQWSPIKVIGRFEAGLGPEALGPDKAQRVAQKKHAARYVLGDVSQAGDSLRLHASLYDAARGSAAVRESAVRLGPTLGGADSAIAVLVSRLLFDDTLVAPGTRSLPARQAFARGLAAVQGWRLATADSDFNAASEYDPAYSRAHLWVAQVRFWNGAQPATWRSSAERAHAGRARLSVRDQGLSDALLALGRDEVEQACGAWDRLTRRDPSDFAAWYGLANCLKGDDVVIRDRRSPSGWRFRSSYHHALQAYQRAFQLLPGIHRSLRGGGYRTIRRILMTGGTSFLRSGKALQPDTLRFVAQVVWQGDTLALIPFRLRDLPASRSLTNRERTATAVRRQRELFRDIATAWVTAYPESPDALEALAISLEMLGDPSCLDTLRRARALETDVGEQLRLAGSEVWMQLKFSIPADLSGLRAARALADSLVHGHISTPLGQSRLLASLAVVAGHGYLAGSFSRSDAADWGVPGPIARTAPTLLIYSSLGGPADSLRVLERRVGSAIDNLLSSQERQPARLQWLARPATLAFPEQRLDAIVTLAGQGDDLLDIQAEYLSGDTVSVIRALEALQTVRGRYAPSDLTLDGLYPEARLLTTLGQYPTAIQWIEPTLNALSATAPQVFADPARAATLVRAMALRAELADRVGDRETAARWARAVTILWSDADDFLQPVVQQMQRLAR